MPPDPTALVLSDLVPRAWLDAAEEEIRELRKEQWRCYDEGVKDAERAWRSEAGWLLWHFRAKDCRAVLAEAIHDGAQVPIGWIRRSLLRKPKRTLLELLTHRVRTRL